MRAHAGLFAALCLFASLNAVRAADPAPDNGESTIDIDVVSQRLDVARQQIQPALGATSYNFSPEALQNIPQGENAPLNQVLLQAPGVAQDSFGQIHLRGEHANVQYRLNGVELPEGLSVWPIWAGSVSSLAHCYNAARMARIHILGASGSGTSTLGSALARRLGVPHVDSDSFFWLPTDPPYTTPRPVEERQALLTRRLPATAHWVFSGAATRWAAPLEPHYDLVVFLRLDPAIRMDRLRRREAARWGARILPGGDMAALSAAFITWAEAYDTAGSLRRGLVTHEAWLADQTAPVLPLDSLAPVNDLVAAVVDRLGQHQ